MKIIQTNACHKLWLLPVIEVSSELTLTYTPSSGRESISFSLFIISNWKPTWSIGIVYLRAKFWRAPNNRQIYQLNQETITQSEQLPCARVTAFSRTSLFLERFWREFWIFFNSTNPSARPTDLKLVFFCLLITFSFPFWYFILRMPS